MLERLYSLFANAGKQLYLVGGPVRDMLLGLPLERLTDLDFATDSLPDQTAEILRKGSFKVFTVGASFGTIGTVLDGREVQITTYRTKEVYKKGSRHPVVHYGTDLKLDLARRDFTINAMAMDAQGQLVDPHGGQADLKAGLLRTPSSAREIFSDDPLRMLRLARFISRLGFRPDEEAASAAREMAGEVLSISRERWKAELDKLLVGEHVVAALRFLAASRLLSFVLPELQAMLLMTGRPQGRWHSKDIWEHTLQVVEQAEPRPAVRWAALLHDVAKPQTRTETDEGEVHFLLHAELGAEIFDGISDRFRFSREERARVRFLVGHHLRPNLYDSAWSDGAVRRLVTDCGPYLEDLLAVSRADITSGNPQRKAAGLRRIDELTARIATVREKDGTAPLLPKGLGMAIIERLGVVPGPEVGRLKALLEAKVVDGALEPRREIEYYLEHLRPGKSD